MRDKRERDAEAYSGSNPWLWSMSNRNINDLNSRTESAILIRYDCLSEGVTLHKSQDGCVECYQTGRGTSCHRGGAESGRIIRPHASVMSNRRPQRAPECVREGSMRFGSRCRQLAFHQQPQGFLENVAPCFTAGNKESQVHRSVLNSRQKNNSTERHSTPYWRRRKEIKEKGTLYHLVKYILWCLINSKNAS